MFDGIDRVVLPMGDVDAAVRLYREHLGFSLDEDEVDDPGWQQIWDLPAPVARVVRLHKHGASGGDIWLAEVPGLPPARPVRRPDRIGPYALDFYLRDAAATEQQLAADGHGFIHEAVHYSLPGTDRPVRERMMVQTDSGLLHACVQYRPGHTRCVLGADELAHVSEVVAVVFLTEDLENAISFAEEVLGAERYFSGVFAGTEVERMLDLALGSGLEMALFRGPTSRNARLELARVVPVSARAPWADPVPRVVASCGVADPSALSGLAHQLASTAHGHLHADVRIGRARHLGFTSRYGARFHFFSRNS
jgi:catechol 2,3-dioxygenase-like lactoylglutathione lyase family enzyme